MRVISGNFVSNIIIFIFCRSLFTIPSSIKMDKWRQRTMGFSRSQLVVVAVQEYEDVHVGLVNWLYRDYLVDAFLHEHSASVKKSNWIAKHLSEIVHRGGFVLCFQEISRLLVESTFDIRLKKKGWVIKWRNILEQKCGRKHEKGGGWWWNTSHVGQLLELSCTHKYVWNMRGNMSWCWCTQFFSAHLPITFFFLSFILRREILKIVSVAQYNRIIFIFYAQRTDIFMQHGMNALDTDRNKVEGI